MKWTTDKDYVVCIDEQGCYCWERTEFIPTYKESDLFIPILYTNSLGIAMRTARNLNDHKERQAR